MRTCAICGRDSSTTTVVEVTISGQGVNICLDDYRAKTGKAYEGPIPQE